MTDPSPENNKSSHSSRSRALLLFTALLLLIGLIWFCYWFFYLQYHESTEDAYANGNLVNINSVISGAVIAFYADDTQLVKEGDLLVQLDKTSYELTYQRELANLASIALEVRQLYENVKTNQAIVRNKRNELGKAQFDYHSRLKLRRENPEAVAQEDYIHSEHDFLSAKLNLEQAESQLQVALSAAGNTKPEHHPLIMKQKEAIRLAFYNLEHCSIYAPATGYVAQRTVDVGQWITPQTNLMAVIPIDYVWIDANFKETQLSNMRIGQPAVVSFDFYGSKIKYSGHIIGIGFGTGSVFSLIPPQNATGNWIKIVQRIPVRIGLDPEKVKEFPIRLGLSAIVDVDVTDQNLPELAKTPELKPIAKTKVFDIHLKEVNEIMNKIIHDQLNQESAPSSL